MQDKERLGRLQIGGESKDTYKQCGILDWLSQHKRVLLKNE